MYEYSTIYKWSYTTLDDNPTPYTRAIDYLTKPQCQPGPLFKTLVGGTQETPKQYKLLLALCCHPDIKVKSLLLKVPHNSDIQLKISEL